MMPASDLALTQPKTSRFGGFTGAPTTPKATAILVIGAVVFLVGFRATFRQLVIE